MTRSGPQQLLVHGLVDHPRVVDFVGADTLQPGSLHRGLNDAFECPIQIRDPLRIRLVVRFLAEPHHDETGFLLCVFTCHISSDVLTTRCMRVPRPGFRPSGPLRAFFLPFDGTTGRTFDTVFKTWNQNGTPRR